jgi:predicted AAA+ superfamily ATPase
LDLLAWRDSRLDLADVLYWRTATGEEVDLVIEAGGRLLPIELGGRDGTAAIASAVAGNL